MQQFDSVFYLFSSMFRFIPLSVDFARFLTFWHQGIFGYRFPRISTGGPSSQMTLPLHTVVLGYGKIKKGFASEKTVTLLSLKNTKEYE